MAYIFIKKSMNNGYGKSVQGFYQELIDEAAVYNSWVGVYELDGLSEYEKEDRIDEIYDRFEWNVSGKGEGKKLLKRLQKTGCVSVETEDGEIMCVGVDEVQCLKAVLTMC